MEFVGRYKLEKDDKFDDFMKELGVPYLIRKSVCLMSPTMIIDYNKSTEQFTISCRVIYNYEIKFKLDQEFEEKLFTGEIVKNLVARNGNELIQRQVTGKTAGVEYIRQVDGNDLNINFSSPSDAEMVMIVPSFTMYQP